MNTTLTSTLRVYADDDGAKALIDTTDRAEIARILAAEGVTFERWDASARSPSGPRWALHAGRSSASYSSKAYS